MHSFVLVAASLIVALVACNRTTPEAVCDHIDDLVEASMKVKPTPSQASEARSNCVERMREKDATCRDCAMHAKSRAEVMACKCL
jgi:hypothetical protein